MCHERGFLWPRAFAFGYTDHRVSALNIWFSYSYFYQIYTEFVLFELMLEFVTLHIYPKFHNDGWHGWKLSRNSSGSE